MINNLPLFDDGNICMDLTQNKFDKIFDNPATYNFQNSKSYFFSPFDIIKIKMKIRNKHSGYNNLGGQK